MQLDREGIAKIFNDEIAAAKFDFEIPKVVSSDFEQSGMLPLNNIIQFERGKNPINKIFDQLSKDRVCDLGQFNHFKSVKIALDIIQNRSIQVSSLSSNDLNDFAEYTEFYKRVGTYFPLVASDFQTKARDNKIDPQEDTPADIDRKNIFVLCFTQDNHNEKFWKNYASNDHGVCIGFRFSNFSDDKRYLFDLRDVFYDTGYSFDFINAINYKLRKHHNKVVLLNGIVQFSKFYKRSKYNWENETRLSFHYDDHLILNHKSILNNIFPIQFDRGSRNYIDLPLEGNEHPNPFFKLTITEVVCGKYVSQEDADELQKSLNKAYPSALFWQRS